jgi:tetratricopeptide (TPR) repeat protein
MPEELQALRGLLLQGIKRSKQGSYARRSPAQAAIHFLEEARHGLKELVKSEEHNAEAWRILSQAEECLLNYGEAIVCLEKAMALAIRRSRDDLKRLALLKESFAEWNKLPLSPEELRLLGDFLIKCGANEEQNGRTLEHTKEWLDENCNSSLNAVIEALKKRGGHTDFLVLYNVVGR